MIVVSNAGPLIALAKIAGLDLLFEQHPQVLTPPAVREEVVEAGLRLGAPDALLLEAAYIAERLSVPAATLAILVGRPNLPVRLCWDAARKKAFCSLSSWEPICC